jgi:hypothetical protein
VAALSGFDPGLDPLPGLSEGDFVCIGSEPGALFVGDCWGTQQKDLPVADSCAQFSLSEIINDSGAFPEPAVTVNEFFGGVPSPGGFLVLLFLLLVWVLKALLMGGGGGGSIEGSWGCKALGASRLPVCPG